LRDLHTFTLTAGTRDVDNSSYIFGTKFKRVNPPTIAHRPGAVSGEPLALAMLGDLRIHSKNDYNLCLDPTYLDQVSGGW
jgi:hypothetical protein